MLRRMQKPYHFTLMLCVGLSGCAVNSTPLDPYDPYEETNRQVFEFNQALDDYLLAPVAGAYAAVTPKFFRRGVDNFFSNVAMPGRILSSALQGKGDEAVESTGRFVINSTFGVLGLFDAAQALGIPKHEEDLGQALAVAGVNSGPYLELPLFGPSYTRELSDLPYAAATNVLTYAFDATVNAPLTVLYVINKRAMLDKAVQIREQAALDPYLFTRSAYMQYRQNLIYDGNPPQDDLYDEDLFDEVDEAVESGE